MTMVLETMTVPLREDQDGTIRVGGTRVPLETVIYHYNEGHTAEEIATFFPVLTLADIYAAITYYLNNREAVDEYIERQDEEAAEIRREVEARPDYQEFRQLLRARRDKLAAQRNSDGT